MYESLGEAATGYETWSSAKMGRAFQSARRTLNTYKVEVLCSAILLVMALNLVATTASKSITADELVIIPAAYYNLVTDDFQLVREHPPACKLLAGIPLLFLQPEEPQPDTLGPTLTRGDREWQYAIRFWLDNRTKFEAISFWSRVPMIALTVGLALLTFIFAREMFGSRAALFAVALFALEPTMLAHGRVVQTDVVAAFGLLLTVYALYRYWRAPNWKLAAFVGAGAGVAMLTKFSMIIVGPALLLVYIALLVFSRRRRSTIGLQGLVAALTLLLVVNAGYFFRHRALAKEDTEWIARSFPDYSTAVLTSVRTLRFVLPTDFLIGIYWQLHHSHEGHPAGLLGMYSQKGWWYYFPVAFALKTPIPFLLVSLASLGWAIYRVGFKRDWQLLFLLVPFLLYTVFVMMSPIDIGIRYYLPAYAFLFISSGALLDSLLRKQRSRRTHLLLASIVLLLLVWAGGEAIRAYPNYMPYMNQLASAHPHWWYLSDSNVEWGDDAKDLAEYLRGRGETRVRALLLGGYVTLGFYGVEYLDALAPVEGSPPRYLALGASFLNGSTVPGYERDGEPVSEAERVNTFAEFRRRAPEAIIGDSIYVYRVDE
ncbi:MAG TPA: glycosyltransferase family 39 protein [Pyrinomonadaceae bacterium]|nr:glycosyltransferase family 39 protein [Pyrinomonadaceae bacterium]